MQGGNEIFSEGNRRELLAGDGCGGGGGGGGGGGRRFLPEQHDLEREREEEREGR